MGDFGVELARLRARRGWTVRELARHASVSEGQICNLESGRRNPTSAVAAACDAATGAGGALIALAEKARRGTLPGSPVEVDSLIAGYGRILEELKDIGRSTGPRFVDASLRSVTRVLTDATSHAEGGRRDDIWLMAAKFAEYTGWMAQETGNFAEALRWTDLAVRWGTKGGDEAIAAYALVRRASIAEHRGDTTAAISLADRAEGHPAATPLIRAHAARREAQGYAAIGDRGACHAALERSQDHAHHDDRRGARWGPRIENANPRLIEASCLISLRRFEQAADLFAVELERHPARPNDRNSRTRFTIRQAIAMAGVDHLDQACHAIEALLPTIRNLDSATIRAELSRFVDQARTHPATQGQRHLIESAAVAAAAQAPPRAGR
ncbi:helix-turn-helix domain-containing protein [Streptomyces beihaiensis]|uniref:Helix-turn-helix domain-containing protein n=1 Tax=Streptomyces beihaiensis TaxID=2984495 RepID=A0ABT3TY50_9ACTN|nr:helix-turn-helix transcriptional regulator [Streptomyces beihaiensis]MCX3061934.1 helix-turn-helix domain-containing protein [Streptomyces beihaiensis]